jgi:hypothetical protein
MQQGGDGQGAGAQPCCHGCNTKAAHVHNAILSATCTVCRFFSSYKGSGPPPADHTQGFDGCRKWAPQGILWLQGFRAYTLAQQGVHGAQRDVSSDEKETQCGMPETNHTHSCAFCPDTASMCVIRVTSTHPDAMLQAHASTSIAQAATLNPLCNADPSKAPRLMQEAVPKPMSRRVPANGTVPACTPPMLSPQMPRVCMPLSSSQCSRHRDS